VGRYRWVILRRAGSVIKVMREAPVPGVTLSNMWVQVKMEEGR
jgi:hypothetical protein